MATHGARQAAASCLAGRHSLRRCCWQIWTSACCFSPDTRIHHASVTSTFGAQIPRRGIKRDGAGGIGGGMKATSILGETSDFFNARLKPPIAGKTPRGIRLNQIAAA